MNSTKIPKIIHIVSVVCIVVLGIALRLSIFDKQGGDYVTYKEAMSSFHHGINPYFATVESFKNSGGEHGYAYFPTLLYIQYGIWLLDNFTGIIISTVILWKIPVLIADLLIVYLLFKKMGTPANVGESILYTSGIFLWFINPYLISRYDYSLYDPLFLLFLFISLDRVKSNSFLSGMLYALSISLKTVPLILFPLFIIKTPKKISLLCVMALVFVLISLPFMKSYDDFSAYLEGAFFVHAERIMQGRPIFSFITYHLQDFGVSTFQHEFERVYSTAALMLSMAIPLTLFKYKKLSDPFSWTLIAFGIYLVFTPVLSRTHILWILPWLIVYICKVSRKVRRVYLPLAIMIVIWATMFIYLSAWNKGFNIEYTPQGKSRLVLERSKTEWEFMRIWRPKYYKIKSDVASILQHR